ncbi:glutamate-5-semialdehyde dehydrogenase [Salinispira pacifica]|uniref:Gamma-glutamyl phosphate reductase n=1 Tax=Salinispira pacifica TaxID=1307761 RepID=V5WE24_9SPIO|nr:glutamate-5-semialdehyde dehydrogenase [Salinispira pacifica]AHC13890.1 Gamma-glutamyl phosphate reductase [Salinispira pacifica]
MIFPRNQTINIFAAAAREYRIFPGCPRTEPMNTRQIAEQAEQASKLSAALPSETKNRALREISAALKAAREEIFRANRRDLERSEAEGLAPPLLKRLKFQEEKLDETLKGLDALVDIPDPVGEVLASRELAPGLELHKLRCPIGVIAMIFESRPDAAVQIASLGLKSGNAVLLKGGSEARETLEVLNRVMHDAAVSAGLPRGWLGQLTSREDVTQLLDMDELVDLIIPRGSNEFVRHIMDNSSIPVMGHADGICHVYVDAQADPRMAESVCVDSKTQYVAVCNAMETLLIHKDAARRMLPDICRALQEKNVELRGCSAARELVPEMKEAVEEDWSSEYLDYILSIKIVDSLEQAVEHINAYGSGHTDSIITGDSAAALQFMNSVDTASALWNCSTRFADGFRYGLGAEVGISTNKIHARGPVGMEGLTIYQWRLFGQGQIVEDFASGKSSFTHKPLSTERYGFSQNER